jgi:hypothetical protein
VYVHREAFDGFNGTAVNTDFNSDATTIGMCAQRALDPVFKNVSTPDSLLRIYFGANDGSWRVFPGSVSPSAFVSMDVDCVGWPFIIASVVGGEVLYIAISSPHRLILQCYHDKPSIAELLFIHVLKCRTRTLTTLNVIVLNMTLDFDHGMYRTAV